jgi:hypothetical protein
VPTDTPTPTPTSTPTVTPQPSFNVKFNTSQPSGYLACNSGTDITVYGNSSDFCSVTTFTSSYFTSLGQNTFWLSNGSSYVQIFHFSGQNTATRSQACQACDNNAPTATPTPTPVPPTATPTPTPVPPTATPTPTPVPTDTPTPTPVPPTATPTPTPCPAAGQLLNTYCDIYDLYGTYTNGACGTYDAFIESNSASCGYTPPAPTDTPTPTPIPPTATPTPTPNAEPTLYTVFTSCNNGKKYYYSYGTLLPIYGYLTLPEYGGDCVYADGNFTNPQDASNGEFVEAFVAYNNEGSCPECV